MNMCGSDPFINEIGETNTKEFKRRRIMETCESGFRGLGLIFNNLSKLFKWPKTFFFFFVECTFSVENHKKMQFITTPLWNCCL